MTFVCLQMEEETQRFIKERTERQKQLQERHNRAIEEFDLQSATMGMDALHIAEATMGPYDNDDDTNSVRGSVLSLTPSTSTNSFTHTHTQLWWGRWTVAVVAIGILEYIIYTTEEYESASPVLLLSAG